MRRAILFIIFLATSKTIGAQNIPDRISFPDTLWAKSDSFFVLASTWDDKWSFSTSESDTIDLGTDGFEGVYVKVWTDIDSVTIPYVNSPFEQWVFIPIVSNNDTTIYRLRFNSQSSLFSTEYIIANSGTTSFSIPETYELSNIILYLTDCSKLTFNHPEGTIYANLVEEHFGSFRNHPLIKVLNKKCSNGNHWPTYYGFRENSLCFEFGEGNLLKYSTPYKHSCSDNSEIMGGEFRNLLYLIQDFVNASNFRNFYRSNITYYEQLEKRLSELEPLKKMWNWLEKEFPFKYNSYKVVFSPLIEGSHSTQKFYKGNFRNPEYKECIMFVNSPESIDSNKEYPESLKEGLVSGIVFTEIDHNYVNPSSEENFKGIKGLIKEKGTWATKEAQQNYSSEYAIFNEYMTHSLYCLYVQETYDEQIGKEIIEKRIRLMSKRGFDKFEQFNLILLEMRNQSSKTIYELYPQIIDAMKSIE